MCGIGSITLADRTASDKYDLQAGVEALLRELDSRGRDACGVMALDAQNKLHVQKAATRAYGFVREMEPIPADTRAVGVHTRFATKGAKEWMKNNHPVVCGDAHICHNGVVDDDDVERKQGDPAVDTFALSAALSAAGKRNKGEAPRAYAKRVAEALSTVDGSAAVIAAIDGEAMMLSIKMHGSPLLYTEADGVRISASTRKAIEECADAMGLELPGQKREVTRTVKGVTTTTTEIYEKIEDAKEGRVLSWQAGAHNMLRIKLPERTYNKSWRQGSGVGKSGARTGSYTGAPYGSTYQGSQQGTSVGYWRSGKFIRWDSQEHKDFQEADKAARDQSKATPTQASTTSYPEGTPKHGTPEYDELARLFKFWRGTTHGLKWARTHPMAAASYDGALKHSLKHGRVPFPTPRELEAMQADPLTFKISDQEAPPADPPAAHEEERSFVGDSCGVVTVESSTDNGASRQPTSGSWDSARWGDELDSDASMQEITARFLRDNGYSHLGESQSHSDFQDWKRCDLCGQECDDVEEYIDGELCGDCARIWAWSDSVAANEQEGRRLDA